MFFSQAIFLQKTPLQLLIGLEHISKVCNGDNGEQIKPLKGLKKNI